MKCLMGVVGATIFLAAWQGTPQPARAQATLDRLDAQIRSQNGQAPNPPNGIAGPYAQAPQGPPAGGRPYLGAIADDKTDRGRGVRVMSVRPGGPADQGGLQPQDLIVGAAGTRVRQLSDLTSTLDLMTAGDKLVLEIDRGGRPQRVDVMLGAQMPAVPNVPGAPQGESIPRPSADRIPTPPPSDGPNLMPVPSTGLGGPSNGMGGDAARIDQLQRRVDQLERRVAELERALSESHHQ